VITSIGLTQMLWSNDTSDWSRPGSQVIFLRAAGPQITNGSVVLMHDGGGPRGQTVAALPRIIAELQRRGYLIRKLPGC
jgi:peptidoglycan/xylan/chitin deacetylase (PgdA/CDA1 family)